MNPEYRKITHKIKKQKEKIGRKNAQFQMRVEEMIDAEEDAIPKLIQKQTTINKANEELKEELLQPETKGTHVNARITLRQMPDDKRYNALKKESKMLINIIKMIGYRAETSVANILAEHLYDGDEKRMPVKQIVNDNADIYPDYEQQTITITLHTLSASRFNRTAT